MNRGAWWATAVPGVANIEHTSTIEIKNRKLQQMHRKYNEESDGNYRTKTIQ